MYNIIQDALLLDLDESDIKKVLKDAQIPAKKIRKLMNGEFVPANFSEARFKKKVKQLEEQAKQLTKDNPDMKFYLDEGYAYPIKVSKNVTEQHIQLLLLANGDSFHSWVAATPNLRT